MNTSSLSLSHSLSICWKVSDCVYFLVLYTFAFLLEKVVRKMWKRNIGKPFSTKKGVHLVGYHINAPKQCVEQSNFHGSIEMVGLSKGGQGCIIPDFHQVFFYLVAHGFCHLTLHKWRLPACQDIHQKSDMVLECFCLTLKPSCSLYLTSFCILMQLDAIYLHKKMSIFTT